jgi:hypothetical protein
MRLTEDLPMKTLPHTLAALCVAACSLAAHAETLRVGIQGGFELPPLTAGPGTLSMNFEVAEPLIGVEPQFAEAFQIRNLTIDSVFNGSPFTSTVNTVGWFSYPASSYHGIDIRLDNVLVPCDRLQFIFGTPVSPFTGSSDAPMLERLVLSGLGGAVCYYGNGTGACTATGTMSDVSYALSAVPEPAAAWLLPPAGHRSAAAPPGARVSSSRSATCCAGTARPPRTARS